MANPKDPDKKGHYLTTGEKIRNFTGWAFAIAIFLELIVMPLYKNFARVHEEQTEAPIQIQHLQTLKPPPTPPPPTPTPPPTPQPRTTPQTHPQPQQPRLKINTVHLHSQGVGPSQEQYHPPKTGTEQGNPTGTAASAPPAPVATPANCANPNQEAHTVDVPPVDYPQAAQDAGLGQVDVIVEVTVGPSGGLVGSPTIMSDPAHNGAIEREALRVARDSTYAPHLVNCQPVTTPYQFIVTFTPE